MNEKENIGDAKKHGICVKFDLASMFDTAFENVAKEKGMTVDQLAALFEAAEQKKILVQKQEEEKRIEEEEEEKRTEEERTDFATFQEFADYLDSVLSYKDKGTFLEHGDHNDLHYFHFDFGVFIRNNFIFRNQSKRELARDCSRIAGRVISDDLSDYELYVTDGDSFGSELMELYYQWLKMIPPFRGG